MLANRSPGLLKAILKGQGNFARALGGAAATTSWYKPHTPTKEERIQTWDYVNSVYFGPERDMKNFPNPTQVEESEPVRLGIFPAKWFEFLEPKLGVSGGYAFFGGLSLWMLSKEIMVIDHDFWAIPGFWGMVYVFHKHSLGGKFKDFVTKKQEEMMYEKHTRPIEEMRQNEEDNMAHLERLLEETQTADFIHQTKKEGVELQLEAAYRQRLQNAYQEVKKRLDYEVEKENLKRRFEQEHMVNWIVSSVTKSITPQQEAESIKSCIATLKQLASKQQATATA